MLNIHIFNESITEIELFFNTGNEEKYKSYYTSDKSGNQYR